MPKRLTTEDFIERAKAVHGDRYDYSRVEYENTATTIVIGCIEHGGFEQIPRNHLSGAGCPNCVVRWKSTTKRFVERARKVHGNRFDYSKVAYESVHQKVTITCFEHGDFDQTPNAHLKGSGCIRCRHQAVGDRSRGTKESFLQSASEVHNGAYDYSEVDYVNSRTKVTILCKEHGEFLQTPGKHIEGSGCPRCGLGKSIDANTKTTSEFVINAQKVHGFKYDYSKTEYVGVHQELLIICPRHGEFRQQAGVHLKGSGCPACTQYGFDPALPALLYYLRIDTRNQTFYKIGITNRSVEERFNMDMELITIIDEQHFDSGADAYEAEQNQLKSFPDDQYVGPDILAQGGNSELFTRDVRGLDNR